ncbi:hypothetical protein KY320_03280, partial [Candidatus Woesearchaeota archaeon]|nr:hypothetical protein [Candidatus Woesearchaeota archaeon]
NSASSPGEMDKLTITAFLSGIQLECTPQVISLVEDEQGEEPKSECKASFTATKEYIAPLHIQLDYVYRQITDTKEIKIRAKQTAP